MPKRIIWNLRRLLDGAEAVGPEGPGHRAIPPGAWAHRGANWPRVWAPIPSKATFSCGGCEPFASQLVELGASKVMVSGIEAHVCVQQTVLDLLANGYRVYVPVDAVGSRYAVDYETGLQADGVGRRHVDHDRGGPVRMVPDSPARPRSRRSAPGARKAARRSEARQRPRAVPQRHATRLSRPRPGINRHETAIRASPRR